MAHEYVPRVEDTTLKRNKQTGIYEYHYTVPAKHTSNGRARTRVRSCGTSDFDLAEQVRKTMLRTEADIVTATSDTKVSALIEKYLDGHVRRENRSKLQEYRLKPILRQFGDLDFYTIRKHDILEYRETREDDGVSMGTIRGELSALKTCLNWCDQEDLLPEDKRIPRIKLPPQGKPREAYLSEDDERAVFELALNDVGKDGRMSRIGRFVCIALCAPARSAAIEGLRWSRVDLKNGLIDFRDPNLPETRKKRVINPISDRLRPVLEKMNSERKNIHPDCPVLDHTGTTVFEWRAWQHEHGIVGTKGERLNRHDLRRTWAILSIMAGVSLEDVAAILGDSIVTTQKHYAHFQPGFLTHAVNRTRRG